MFDLNSLDGGAVAVTQDALDTLDGSLRAGCT